MIKFLLSFLFAAATAAATARGHLADTCHCDSCMDVKIGRMIVSGFRGTVPSEEIEEAIVRYHVGGVILFDVDVPGGMGERNIRSPRQLKALTAALRSLSDGPLLIAVDQEGGMVNRLKSRYGFPPTVTAAAQGASGSPDSASLRAAQTASVLAGCGINVNFAPCVDLNLNPSNPIIARYGRSFSSDPDSVCLFAGRWVEEHHRRGIVTSLKHFPGHGSSRSDSHLGLVDITDTWRPEELVPYRRFVENGYEGIVMVGHLVNRRIDPLYPASLSHKTLTGLLRERLGFGGVIATDDMNMGAIVDNYSLEKALALAINGGVNLIVVGNNAAVYEKNLAVRCHGIIKSGVASGEIGADKIDDSYARIMKLLEDFGYGEPGGRESE